MHRDERMQAISPLRQVFNHLMSHSPRGNDSYANRSTTNVQHQLINMVANAPIQSQNSLILRPHRSKSRTSQVSNQPTPSISDQRAQKILKNETVEDNNDLNFYSIQVSDMQLRNAQSRLEEQLNAKKQLLHQKMMGVASKQTVVEQHSKISEESLFVRDNRQFEQMNPHHGYVEKAKELNRTNTQQSGQQVQSYRIVPNDDGLSLNMNDVGHKKTGFKTQTNSAQKKVADEQRLKNEELKREYLALLAFQSNLKKQKGSQLDKQKSQGERTRFRSPSVDVISEHGKRNQQRNQLADESFGRQGDHGLEDEDHVVTLQRKARQNYPDKTMQMQHENSASYKQSASQIYEQNEVGRRLSRSPMSPRNIIVNPDQVKTESRAVDAIKMKNSRTFVANFAAGDLDKNHQASIKDSDNFNIRNSSIGKKLRSDMNLDSSSTHANSKIVNKSQEQNSLSAYAVKAKGSVTQLASPNRPVDKRQKVKREIDIIDQQTASGITSPRIIVHQGIKDPKTRNRHTKQSAWIKTSSVQQSLESSQIKFSKTNQHSTQKQIQKNAQKDDFLSRSNSQQSQVSLQKEEIGVSSSNSQQHLADEYGSQDYGSENASGSEDDYMADDQSETVNHRRGPQIKKQRLSDSDSDQPTRDIFSGDDKQRIRSKHKGSQNANFANFSVSAQRKTPRTKQKIDQRNRKRHEEVDQEYSSSDDEYTHKSQRSKRNQRKAKKTDKNKNYDITTNSHRGYRNNGLKININMKGLDKNSLSSEKGHGQEFELQNKLQMMYGHMMPNLDPMQFSLPQYAPNPNLAAAMHLQNQLNMLTMQQQNMLRMQGVQGQYGQFPQQFQAPKEPEINVKMEQNEKTQTETKINWISMVDDKSQRQEETHAMPKIREPAKDRYEQLQPEEQIIMIEPEPARYADEFEPTAVFDEPSFANQQKDSNQSIEMVVTAEKAIQEPRPEPIVARTDPKQAQAVLDRLEQPVLEHKRNTALVICFDDNADQEALRNPFNKKPKLRSKLATPSTKGKVQEEPLPLKSQEKAQQKKPQAQPVDKAEKDAMRIEIFFDEPIKGNAHNSIAEAFIQKRKIAQSVLVDQDSAAMSQQAKDASTVRKTKTKEELAELRKQMMKKRKTATSAQANEQPDQRHQFDNPYGICLLTENPNYGAHTFTQGNKKDNINYALMDRLATGSKVKVDKQEMKKLTKKNYEALPENKKKRDEEKKRQEATERQAKINQYKRELDERRKANLRKKQKASIAESYDQISIQTLSKGEFSARVDNQRLTTFEEYKVIGDNKSARR